MKSPGRLGWNLDIGMRYLPILPLLRRLVRAEPSSSILEIGPGPLGLAWFLKHPITAVEPSWEETPQENMLQIAAEADRLPFSPAQFDAVVSLDVLEHIPVGRRPAAVAEAVRVAGKIVCIGCPEGAASRAQDERLDNYWRRRRRGSYYFLAEHLSGDYPRSGELEEYIRAAVAKHGRAVKYMRGIWNANLCFHELWMRLWINPSRWSQMVYRACSTFLYAEPLLRARPCYRRIFIVEFQ